MNIVLIGSRGCGKSVVGCLLAKQLNYDLVQMDDEIIGLAGKQIPEIVSEFGWNHFRDLESKVAEAVGKRDNCVIDTGGGVILREKNMKELGKNGKIIWLKADISAIKNRIKDDNQRPSLTGSKSFVDEIQEVLEKRIPIYQKYADLIVDTTNIPIKKVAEQILTICKL